MIFVFDKSNEHGIIPNLVKRTDIIPKTKEWWDLAITPPYSFEFRFLNYLKIEGIQFQVKNVDQLANSDEIGLYPINLNFFDSTIDYFSLMSERARNLVKNNKLNILFYYSEGDDIEWHIKTRLADLASEYQFPPQRIKFVIANARVNCSNYHYFPDDELYYRYLNKDNDFVTEVNFESRTKKFTCLNRMDKPFRKLFAAHVWHDNLHHNSFFSYTGQNYAVEFPTNFRKLENEWNTHWPYAPSIVDKFEQGIPYLCDDLPDHLHNNHKLIDKRFFSDAYWNVVVETHINKNNLFLTEKTFKPILNLQPFVIVGSVGSLDLLHRLGYKTFDCVIDESYDKEENNELRLRKVFEIVKEFSNWDDQQHIQVQKRIQEILLFNQKHFLSSKKYRLLDLMSSVSDENLQ